jgi:hypothetical protein
MQGNLRMRMRAQEGFTLDADRLVAKGGSLGGASDDAYV